MTHPLYNATIEERLARTKEAIASCDYEGVTTLPTADVYEILRHVEKLENKS